MITNLHTEYDEDTVLETYTYNKDNTINTLSISTSNPNNIENGKKFKYTYKKDNKNRIIRKTEVNISSEDNYTLVYTYKYDENNRIIKETQTSENSSYELNYIYDDWNNVIQKVSKRIDKTESTSTHTYKYAVIGVKNY